MKGFDDTRKELLDQKTISRIENGKDVHTLDTLGMKVGTLDV